MSIAHSRDKNTDGFSSFMLLLVVLCYQVIISGFITLRDSPIYRYVGFIVSGSVSKAICS